MEYDKKQLNKGKTCVFKEKKHYVVHESVNYVLISKKKNLKKAFKVDTNEIKLDDK